MPHVVTRLQLRDTNKRVKDCIEFYYLWKKVCADEYKRFRIMRRHTDQSLKTSKPAADIAVGQHDDDDSPLQVCRVLYSYIDFPDN